MVKHLHRERFTSKGSIFHVLPCIGKRGLRSLVLQINEYLSHGSSFGINLLMETHGVFISYFMCVLYNHVHHVPQPLRTPLPNINNIVEQVINIAKLSVRVTKI